MIEEYENPVDMRDFTIKDYLNDYNDLTDDLQTGASDYWKPTTYTYYQWLVCYLSQRGLI